MTTTDPSAYPMDNFDKSVEVGAEENAKPKSRCQRFFAWDGSLLLLTLIGAIIGLAIGLALYYAGASETARIWIGIPGELYMRMLKAAVLPLIVSSIITGTAGLKPKDNGRVTGVALTYIIITNITGAVVGTLLAVAIEPGVTDTTTIKDNSTHGLSRELETSDLFADLIRNFVPDNVVTACFQKTQTMFKPDTHARYLGVSSGTNILGLVIASAALGMAAAQKGEEATPFLHFFSAAAEVIIRLVQWMIWTTPLGVASLISKAIGSTTDLEATFKGLGFFVLAEVIGNFLTGIVFIALIYLVIMRKNPFQFLLDASRAVITGIASASSAVAMPEVLNCVENHYMVDHRVSRFVVPVSTALNRDGSAMFIACTSIYIAQLHGSDTANNIILIAVLAAVGSLAIPGVPSSSIVTILMILASLDIPPANLGIVIALEWFSDRMRAVPNVYGHVLCAVLTWHFCKVSLGFVTENENTPKSEISKADQPPSSDVHDVNDKPSRNQENVNSAFEDTTASCRL